MQIFRINRLPLFQAPDTPTDPVDPPAAVVDPAAAPEPEPVAEPVTPPEPENQPHGNKGKTPWYMKEIADLRHDKRTLSEEREADRRRLSDMEEIVRRLQGGQNPDTPAPKPAMDDQAIEARARQLADQRVAQTQIDAVVAAGRAAFPGEWGQIAETLGAVNAASPEFVLDVAAIDSMNAHKILRQLADNPERAAELARMDGRRRTAELTRMSMALNAPPAEPVKDNKGVPQPKVSKAPAPPPPVDPGTAQPVDWRSDKTSDADFSKAWEENARKRASMRR